MTGEDGQYSFTYTDLPAFPDTITVVGSLTTHLEGEPPNETPHVVQFVATTQVFDTVEVKIDPSSQGLPTREPIVGGLFSVSFPKRASIDLHHYWVAITNSFSPFAIFMATGAPTGNTDVFAIEPDSVLRATGPHGLLANDTDSDSPMTAELVIAPLHGTMAFSADGSFEYSPEPGFVGEDAFSYRPLDDVHLGSLTNVTIFVTPHPLGVSTSLEHSAAVTRTPARSIPTSLTGT